MAREPHQELASKREPPARPPGRACRPGPVEPRRAPARARVHPLDEPTAIGDEALITGLVAAMTRDDLEARPCKDETTLVDAGLAERIASERALVRGRPQPLPHDAVPPGDAPPTSSAPRAAPPTAHRRAPTPVPLAAPWVMPLPPLARHRAPAPGAHALSERAASPAPSRLLEPRTRAVIALLSGCVLAIMTIAVAWGTTAADAPTPGDTTLFTRAKE